MTHEDITIPYGFCHCGCGQKTSIIKDNHTRLQRVKGEPSKFIRGHQHRSKKNEYIVDELTGCWNWQRAMMTSGYGKACVGRQVIEAHRLSFMRTKGNIPDGFHVHHVCNNKRCINPNHLEAVRPLDNQRLKPSTILTESDVREIRGLGKAVTSKEIASRYGINQSYVAGLRSGKTWKDIK